MKRILIIITLITLMLAIPITVFLARQNQDIRQKAAPATTLSFSPQSKAVAANEEFSVDVIVDAGENLITAADITVTFDAQFLTAVSIQKGSFLPNTLIAGEVAPGTASIALGAPDTTPGTGTGTVARITFMPTAATSAPTALRFSQPETQVIGIGEQGNVLVGTTPGSITIGQGSSDNTTLPTPTPIASASATLTTTVITKPKAQEITGAKPLISGTSFPSARITITITDTSPISDVFSANTSGAFSYTPLKNLANGSHVITVTAQNPTTDIVETVTQTFTVATTGGVPIASSSGTIPKSGTTAPTIILLITGATLFIGGLLFAL